MAAALLTAYGQPPRPARHQLPAARDGQCRVRVTAAPITALDLRCGTGSSYLGAPALPHRRSPASWRRRIDTYPGLG
jgi:NADPH2:quinone reductase